MLQDIVEAIPLENNLLKLRFEDGAEGVVDVAKCVSFTGVFAPLHERTEFTAVQVNEELGTVCWPCGADLDPDVLYALATGAKIPSLEKNRGPPVKQGGHKGTLWRNERMQLHLLHFLGMADDIQMHGMRGVVTLHRHRADREISGRMMRCNGHDVLDFYTN